MVKINWSRRSVDDLKTIHNYISADSFFYASRFIDKLISAVEYLENFPYSGRIVPEKNDETIREVIVGNYRIFYKIVSPNLISVLRIHHSSRNIK